MLGGLYGSFYRQARRLSVPSMRTLWFALLVFVLVRGLTDTEPFDLSLPLWAILMISILIEDKQTTTVHESVANFVGPLSFLSV
jgi:hypothetical protein